MRLENHPFISQASFLNNTSSANTDHSYPTDPSSFGSTGSDHTPFSANPDEGGCVINGKLKTVRFGTGTVELLVERVSYVVDRYSLCQNSEPFRKLLRGKETIPLEDVLSRDFERFLHVLYSYDPSLHTLSSADEWLSVLRVVYAYEFTSLQQLALKSLSLFPADTEYSVLGHSFGCGDGLLDINVTSCEHEEEPDAGKGQRLKIENTGCTSALPQKPRDVLRAESNILYLILRHRPHAALTEAHQEEPHTCGCESAAKVNGWIKRTDKCQETEAEKVKALRYAKLWIEGTRRNRLEEESNQKKRNRAVLRRSWL